MIKYLIISFIFCGIIRAESIDNVKLVKVYDGDTVFVNINCQYKVFCDRIGVRLYGIDTPELRTRNKCEKQKAIKVRNFVAKKLYLAKRIDLINIKRDKYFRINAIVLYDGRSLNRELVNNRLAIEYYGGTKKKVNWCNF